MPAFALEAWVRPLVPRIDGDQLQLLCPSAFHRDRVRERLLVHIARCVEAELGRPIEVVVVANPAPPDAAPRLRDESASSEASHPPRERTLPAPRTQPSRPAQPALPHQTFDNFVVGPCNALAREASLAVAHGRQRVLNPLYLASQPGLGKTHLARAIVGNVRLEGRQRVIYASAETFTNDFMASIRARRMDLFKRRYRRGCDLLVLEDVQFLEAKKATQLELFHTLSHLLDAGYRIVLTGDRLPRDIDKLETRLRSQMAAGLVAELEAPDASVRRKILRSRAAAGGVRLPDDCLQLLVASIRGSVRDLEGVLVQLVASAALLKRRIDLELTRAALHKVAPDALRARRLEPAAVTEVVAAFFRTTPSRLASRSRRRDVLVPRQLAMYLCRRYTDASLAEIGAAFGRDHPAVSNAVRVVERRMLERAPLRYQVEALCERLEALGSR